MSIENHWPIGNIIRVRGTFTDAANAAIDPATVRFKFKRPDTSVVTTYVYGVDAQLVKDSTGVYHADVTGDAAGAWFYRFDSTGTGQAAIEGSFYIDASKVA